MTDPDSLMRIKEVAERRRDAGARELARLAVRVREAQQRLQLLLDYRRDYRARFDAASRAGMQGEWLRNYQSFLANLEQAIALQNGALATLGNDVAAAKRRFDGEHRRAESYRIIDDRRGDERRRSEQRRQQRQQDEIASRMSSGLVAHGKT